MRYSLDNALLTIQTCVILHNLAIRWRDVAPNRDMYVDGPDGLEYPDAEHDDVVIDYNEVPRQVLDY